MTDLIIHVVYGSVALHQIALTYFHPSTLFNHILVLLVTDLVCMEHT